MPELAADEVRSASDSMKTGLTTASSPDMSKARTTAAIAAMLLRTVLADCHARKAVKGP